MGKPVLHAEALRAWADGKEIQYQMSCNPSEVWGDATHNHDLVIFDSAQYKLRIKPRTININGFEVPEPFRGNLSVRQEYFIVSIQADCIGTRIVGVEHNINLETGRKHVSLGIVHLTEAAAELHARALLSFTAKQGE